MPRLTKAPIAIEAVACIDTLFAIERKINGSSLQERRKIRQERSRPLAQPLGIWLRQQHAKLSPASQVAKAIAYSLNCWEALTCFLDDDRLCLTKNAAERALRGIAVGRCNWAFAGSDAGGRRAAAIYTLIETAKLNDIDPQALLADMLTRLQDHPARRIAELLPWKWKLPPQHRAAARAACANPPRLFNTHNRGHHWTRTHRRKPSSPVNESSATLCGHSRSGSPPSFSPIQTGALSPRQTITKLFGAIDLSAQ